MKLLDYYLHKSTFINPPQGIEKKIENKTSI